MAARRLVQWPRDRGQDAGRGRFRRYRQACRKSCAVARHEAWSASTRRSARTRRCGAKSRRRRWPFDELLRTADVVTLHVPLTPATRGLLGRRATRADETRRDSRSTPRAAAWSTKPRWLRRSSRARLGGAALDVFEHEPLPAGSPLAGCPNLILTPHVAGVTRESNVRVSTLIADKVAAALRR